MYRTSHIFHRILATTTLLLAVFALAACGGGSTGEGVDNTSRTIKSTSENGSITTVSRSSINNLEGDELAQLPTADNDVNPNTNGLDGDELVSDNGNQPQLPTADNGVNPNTNGSGPAEPSTPPDNSANNTDQVDNPARSDLPRIDRTVVAGIKGLNGVPVREYGEISGEVSNPGDYGAWLSRMPSDNTIYVIWVWTDAQDENPTYNFSSYEGTANYRGDALGYAYQEDNNGNTLAAERFTADVNFQATFGETTKITGTFNNFDIGGSGYDPGWSVNTIYAPQSYQFEAAGDAIRTGSYISYEGFGDGTQPDEIRGELEFRFVDGRAVGAYGADKQ